MICIFCRGEKDNSDEHVFPSSIGGTLRIRRVCQACNSLLGRSADSTLANHIFVQMQRALLQIPNRQGVLASVFGTVLDKGCLADNPEQKVKVSLDTETGRAKVKLLFNEVSTATKSGEVVRRITLDASDSQKVLPKLIQRERARGGLKPLCERDLAKIVSCLTSRPHNIGNPTVKHDLKIDTTLFTLGLCKIAFECAWLALGDRYLNDPISEQLGSALLTGQLESLTGNGAIGPQRAFEFWQRQSNVHLSHILSVNGRVVASVRVFGELAGSFVMSENPEFCEELRASGGWFLCIDPTTGDIRQTTFAEECNRLSQRA